MEFTCHLPINSLSLGQCSFNILAEFYKQGLSPLIFPIGNVDVSAFNNPPEGFFPWLQERINQAPTSHRKTNPTFKIWHLEGSLESLSKKQVLFSFHETDTVTAIEKNIARNNDRVIFSSPFSVDVFKETGLDNIRYVPLGFDSAHFKKTGRKYHNDDVIYFGLVGKLENRKRHLDVLRTWAKKYGNRPNFFLNCALFNPFLKPELQQQLVFQALEGKNYYNINFNPFMDTNSTYNDFLNSNDIILGLSGGEGWGLPEFQSAALGKHAVILDATGYKAWANEKNSVLVSPNGKSPCYDNVFFHQGRPFSQGNFYTWDQNDVENAFEKAIDRVRTSKENKEGLKLAEEFTWKRTANEILKELESI